MDEPLNLIEMELRELQLRDDPGQPQVVLLAERAGARLLPIFIGYHEALALDMALHGVAYKRPMTHDLIGNILDGVGADLRHVLVDDLNEDTFYGKLAIRLASGVEELIDARPSDALVLAARRGAPIFAAESVLERAGRAPG